MLSSLSFHFVWTHKMEQGDYQNVSDVLLQRNHHQIHSTREIKLYRKRWIILTIYTLYATMNAAEWFEYSIIANIIMKYYNVTALAVDWTSIIYMACYMPFVIPTTYIIDTWVSFKGSKLLGGLGTALGTIIKIFAASHDFFWVIIVGQTILSISQVPVLCLPPKIAAVWFGPNEVSTACSIGVLGMQLGMALGFLLPPIIVKNHDVMEDIGSDLYVMHWTYSGIMIAIGILVIIFFPAQPKLPPSLTQLKERNNRSTGGASDFLSSVKSLLKIKAFVLHLVGFGVNTGIFCAIGALLNQFVLNYFPNSEEDAGRMGEVALGLYFMSSIGVLLFMYALESKSKLLVYLSASFLGLCTNSYIPVGFELAVELTYPISESTTSGFLMGVSQSLGVGFTLMLGKLFAIFGTYWALCSQVILLALGAIITFAIPNKMRRQDAFRKEEKQNVLMNSMLKQ